MLYVHIVISVRWHIFAVPSHSIGYNSPLFTLQVFLWNMDKYTLIQKLEGHHNDVVSCEFSPDGALLATASYDTRVIVWDHHKATILLELGYDKRTLWGPGHCYSLLHRFWFSLPID